MWEGSVESPIVFDGEEDKENSPPPAPPTPVSVTTTETLRLQRSRAFGAKTENVSNYVYRKLFQ